MRFKLGKRVVRVTKWIFRRFKTRPKYIRLGSTSTSDNSPMTKLLTWGRKLKRALSSTPKIGSGYIPLVSDPKNEMPLPVPKGHLAVYVGQKDGDFHRVLIPVVYFNHPLFCELLKEAEKEYGFCHQGGITIPCRVTEFERVKTRIASGSGVRNRTRRSAWQHHC